MAPRWTYTEANATRWRHLFDDLLDGTTALEVPLEGNGKSLCSLRIRISDALKWLADQFRAGNADMEPYALLKRRIRYTATDSALRIHLKRPHAYRPIPHLDPALRARLVSALQRPDLKPTTRAKIKAALKQPETDAPGDFRQLLPRRPSPGLSHRGQAP
jgi:hypothetical protein